MKLSSSDTIYKQMHENQTALVSKPGLRGKIMLRLQYYTPTVMSE